MAKGIPLMGRGPDGTAKIINVDENGNVKVQPPGIIVSKTVLTQVLNAGPANRTQIFTVTPPVGELWKVKSVILNIPEPTNATGGKHRFVIRAFGSNSFYNMVDVESNFGDPIEIKGNILVGTGTKVPATEIAQQNAIGMLVATNSMPLTIVYVNSTDVLQNNTMFLEIVKEVVLLG